MKKLRMVLILLLAAALLGACGAAETAVLQTGTAGQAPTPVQTTPPDNIPTPIPTTPPDETGAATTPAPEEAQESSANAVITVRDGDTLERDIMPQIAVALDVPERYVEDALAQAQSDLISDEAQGFRRMEGIIPPGSYAVDGMTLSECVQMLVSEAEERYEHVTGRMRNANGLSAAERLTLGSIVEWETVLEDDDERDVAAAFLNRLDTEEKLQSSATAEYALGYARPYLTSDDTKVQSPYNTYVTRGLPPGPICAMDDESLTAASAKAKDKDTYYFFYDYALKKIVTFDNYDDFMGALEASETRFDETFGIGRYDKIDKRQYFGG